MHCPGLTADEQLAIRNYVEQTGMQVASDIQTDTPESFCKAIIGSDALLICLTADHIVESSVLITMAYLHGKSVLTLIENQVNVSPLVINMTTSQLRFDQTANIPELIARHWIE